MHPFLPPHQFTGSNIQLETLATSISRREADSERIKDSLNFADIFVNSLHQSTSVLDNDAMRTSRLWESVFTTGPGTGEYYNRSFSSGRVAFSVPSQYFESIADRALVDSTTMEQLCTELSKIEDYYLYQIKEGKRPGEIDEKVRAAMIQKINELKMSNAFSK